MRELRLANVPVTPALPEGPAWRGSPLSRAALVLSLLAHVVGVYLASRWEWVGEPPVLPEPAAAFWLEPPRPAPAIIPETAPVVVDAPVEPPTVEVTPAPAAEPPQARAAAPSAPAPAVVDVAPDRPSEQAEQPEPPPAVVPSPVSPSPLAPRITRLELEDVRRSAASAVVEEGAAESEFLTFSVDDVAPPRAAPAEERRSIFDGTGATRASRTTVGQQRTRIGRTVAEICNALTGGFSFMGLGSFCAEADDEPSGLFPEVRPEILDLMPECVETRPLAEQLGEESEFPTVKCELVPKKELPARWALP